MRPLEKVPTRALYALHKGSEGRLRLIAHELEDSNGDTCAIGSLGINAWDADRATYEIGLGCDNNGNYMKRKAVVYLNNAFNGTPEERREFMLRHIVEELRQREKSLPVKKAEYQEVK